MIENLLKFNVSQLLQSDIIDLVKKESDRIIRQFDVKGATWLSNFLQSKIREDASLDQVYKEIIAKLDFIRIGLLADNQFFELVRNDFIVTFSFPLDIITPLDIIKRRLISTTFVQEEHLRDGINAALKENNNLITVKKIFLESRKEEIAPTISNWILDYDLRVGGKTDRSLARAEYLTNGFNITKLSEEEKIKITELIKVYDFVNTDSLIPSAYPEDLIVSWKDGCSFIISQGETVASLAPNKNFDNLSKEFKSISKKNTGEQSINQIDQSKNSFEEKYLEESKDQNIENSK